MNRFDGVHDLDDVRECLSRLSFAFTGLLGHQPNRVLAAQRLGELAGIAHEIGVLCEQRAARLTVTPGEVGR
ncbi:MAG TPA: hypothetical protein VNO31_09615 [Umezawaea sp.]|nr:hypothetical protein [Umezawaea sp.]